jgi:hypothetical protein
MANNGRVVYANIDSTLPSFRWKQPSYSMLVRGIKEKLQTNEYHSITREIAELIGLINMWNKSGIVPDFSRGNGSGSIGPKSKLDEKLIGIDHHA